MDSNPDLRKIIKVPIRETLKEVDPNTWLIGCLLLHRSIGYCDTATWFDDGDNSSYTVTEAPTPPPQANLLSPNNALISKIHDVADGSAVWAIGSKAICKVHLHYSQENRTPEDVTLKWVKDRLPDLQVPEVLHSITYHDYRSILIETRVPGRTLGDAWPSLSSERREYYMNAVADICESLAEWKGDKICGVDGRNTGEYYLLPLDPPLHVGASNLSPEILRRTCISLGMDCSSFGFTHTDLGPGNIIVDDKRVGIIDWEGSGYFPKGWISTKFNVSPAMDLPEEFEGDVHEFRRGVCRLLISRGFECHGSAYMAAAEEAMKNWESSSDC